MSHCPNHLRSFHQSHTLYPVLAVVLLVMSSGCGCGSGQPTPGQTQADRNTVAIREVFRQRAIAAEKYTAGMKNDRLAATQNYVHALRQIDLRPCPSDFQDVFLKHRYAWDEIPPFLEKYPESIVGDGLKLFEFSLAVVKHGSLTTEGEKEFERIRKSISSTNFEVEKTALRYGVQDGL